MAVPSAPPGAPVHVSALHPRVIARSVVVILLVIFAVWLIYQLRQPLTWIFIAGFLAIALSSPVALLSRW